MEKSATSLSSSRPIAGAIRQRIERSGERLWRLEDFSDLPSSSAIAQALSRLTRQGTIERLSKGLYYRHRTTAFGKSSPNPAEIQKLAASQTPIFPSGIAAANLLGFSTQTARRGEISTIAGSLPRKLIGSETIVHTRRPEAWAYLSQTDAALLDFLRAKGLTSEMSSEDTTRRTLALFSECGRFETLLEISDSEPPRVRAMLGAIGQCLDKPPRMLKRVRTRLNPLSRFDFGKLAALAHARNWQAKEQH